ncbi:hypothetical protein ACFLVN_05175 [Chloroflexota bacterium]
MGKRDYRHREQKKHKKDTKKLPPITILPATMGVEVIKKGKQKRGEEEEEER